MTTPIEPNPPRWSPSADPSSILIPGLDTNASVNDQIDQIEQLITIKLQNIDANFSRIQHLMSTKLLPAVKRYAVGTEPVREAAKFWTSFYEQAAQVHIPTLEDYDSMQDEQTEPSVAATSEPAPSVQCQEEDSNVTPLRTTPSDIATETFDMMTSESSFMPANAVSSTPARPGHASDRTVDEQPSWSASLESPMVRLKSQLQSFAHEEEEEESVRQDTSSFADSIMYEEENTVQQLPPIVQAKTEKRTTGHDRKEPKAKIQGSQIPRSMLPTPRANATNPHVSPLKVKPKTPVTIPEHIQSLLPEKLEKEPTFASPRRPRYERTPRKPTVTASSTSTSMSTSSSTLDIPSLTRHASDSNHEPKFTMFNDSFDDSVDLMQGMSPPRMLAFARAPRSSVGLGLLPPLGRTPGRDILPILGRTPGREAADRIRQDLLGDMHSQLGSANSAASNKLRTPAFGYGTGTAKDDTMSTIPTPPSLSRYMRHAYPSWTDSNDTDTSLATMMRRVGLEDPEPSHSVVSSSHSRALSQVDAGSNAHTPPLMEDELQTPSHQGLDVFEQGDQSTIQLGSQPLTHMDSDSDSDSDSLDDEPIHSSQPSTAFLMASSREPGPDDSFESSSSNHSSDSLAADDFHAGDEAAVHPFARPLEVGGVDEDGFDDSFDSEGGYEAGQGEDPSQPTEETVFGIPPVQRWQQGREAGQLRMLGEDLLQDTIGIGGQLAKAGRIEESPTPYGRS